MQLQKAIKQALKICPKENEKAMFRFVRFLPVSAGQSFVYCTDGVCIIAVLVEQELPSVLLPADQLTPVISHHKDDMTVTAGAYGRVTFKTVFSAFDVQAVNAEKFPMLPAIPTPTGRLEYTAVKSILHAAASVKDSQQFSVLNFGEGRIEACDNTRFARVQVPHVVRGLVPARLFKGWTKGELTVAEQDNTVFFGLKDEMRIAPLAQHTYPDASISVPLIHGGPRSVVGTDDLKSAVSCSLDISPLGFIQVIVRWDYVEVCALGLDNKDDTYVARIPATSEPDDLEDPVVLNVNGKLLKQALQNVSDTTVALGLGNPGNVAHPLRIDAGPFTACIWQLVL